MAAGGGVTSWLIFQVRRARGIYLAQGWWGQGGADKSPKTLIEYILSRVRDI